MLDKVKMFLLWYYVNLKQMVIDDGGDRDGEKERGWKD